MMRRYETNAFIPHPAEGIFARLDQHTLLSSHMGKPNWMMGWGRMEIELDEGQGKRIGSHIRLTGRALGIPLKVEEVVTERDPPRSKRWETTGSPRLLVMGSYRMGFEIIPQGSASMLRVFIEYSLPDTVPSRWFGCLLGQYYAKWCVRQMADDAVNHFIPARREQP